MERIPGGILRIVSGGFAVASLTPPKSMSAATKNKLAIAGAKEDDLLYLTYPLVHEGKNLNDDTFLRDEMLAAYKTLEGTQVDKDHSQNIDDVVGKNYVSEFVDASDGAVIVVGSYIYKNLYPDLAYKIQDGTINAVSMETHFEWAERNAHERILHGLTFCGAGLVRTPADPAALLKYYTNKPKSVEADRKQLLAIAAMVAAMEVANV